MEFAGEISRLLQISIPGFGQNNDDIITFAQPKPPSSPSAATQPFLILISLYGMHNLLTIWGLWSQQTAYRSGSLSSNDAPFWVLFVLTRKKSHHVQKQYKGFDQSCSPPISMLFRSLCSRRASFSSSSSVC